MDKKQFYKFEQIFKGVASKQRMRILDLLGKKPEQTVAEISESIRLDFRTTSEHLRKMAIAGLIMKRHQGPSVHHALTKRGKAILQFCRNTE